MEKQLIPLQEAFSALGVKNTKGYWLVNQGYLTVIKIGAKSLADPDEVKSLKQRLVSEAKAKVMEAA